MDNRDIKYKKLIKKDLNRIINFLYREDNSFTEKLSKRVDIEEFANKIIKYR